MQTFSKKRSLYFIIILFIFFVVFLLPSLITLNQYKPFLKNKIEHAIHKNVNINGDITISLAPYLALHVGQINILEKNNKTLANIQKLTVSAGWRSLLHGRVEPNKINIQDISIYANKRAIHLRHIKAALSPTADHSIPFNISFSTFQENRPATLRTVITGNFNQAKNLYRVKDFDILFQLTNNDNVLNSNLSLDIAFDLDAQRLEINNLNGNIGNLPFKAQLLATNLKKNYTIQGQILLNSFNLKDLLDKFTKNRKLRAAQYKGGTIEFTASRNNIEVKLISMLEEIRINKAKFENINLQAYYKNGLLNINPLFMGIAGGSLETYLTLAIKPTDVFINTKTIINNVNLPPNFNPQANELGLSGNINGVIELSTKGKGMNSIIRNLTGTAKLNAANGDLAGFDLRYLIQNTMAQNKQYTPMLLNTHKTVFTTLASTFYLQNSTLTAKDFYINSPEFETHGGGKIDLIDLALNYNLQSQLKSQARDDALFAALPPKMAAITLNGTLKRPNIIITLQPVKNFQDKL